MDKKIGMIASAANALAVTTFAVFLVVDFYFGAVIASIFIALSFVPMVAAFAAKGKAETRATGNTAMIFAAIYATFILMVYFTQVTTLHNESIGGEIGFMLNYQNFSWFFNLNLLGYGMMSLSTFFAGLTVSGSTKTSKALRIMLMGHGIFFISSFIMPILGVFTNMDGSDATWIGSLVLLIWSAIFLPIGILSFDYFRKGVQ